MKREKFIFATLLIPFFLFSLNLRLTRLDREDKAASPYRPQETKYLVGENLLAKSKQNVPEKNSVERRLQLTRKTKDVVTGFLAPKIVTKIRPENLASSRRDKRPKKDSFSYQNRINNLNEGNPLRSNGVQYVPDQVLVKFKSSLSEEIREATVAAYQARKIRRIPRIDIYQIQTPENVSVEEMLYLLEQNPDVEYAAPNHLRHLAITPNDPLFGQQYALYNPNQIVPPGSPQQGIDRSDIRAREAWEETMGDDDVIIAILDTGVDFGHPDLDDKLLMNGYDFVNDDSDPTDDHYHGTFVAGIAAAETNNDEGIAGVAWNCKILPIKIADNTGWVDVATEILGIERAVQSGAHVINLSIAGPGSSPPERDAIRNAYNNGIVVVAAAGNSGAGTEYPAAYDECLAVAATDSEDLNTAWSNYGPEIDVAAPGEEIVGPVPTWYWGPGSFPYASGDGTSFSAPHVAGLAALIIGIKGLEEGDVLLDDDDILMVEDVMNIIRYTADDVNYANYPGRDDFIGYGRINMERALVPIIISSLNIKR
ncbi:MAG: S8 family serine peptidase [Candidatus Aminicenantes bacterium]|nr:MAG: S8 family serine peptidase [Candidatus Aminicenantes bacterium]